MAKAKGWGIGLVILLLAVSCFADVEIYCPECKTHLYNYKKDEIARYDNTLARQPKVLASDMQTVGIWPNPKERDKAICPLCTAPLNGWEYWAWKNGYQKPTFQLYVISLMTKIDGKFVWVPYDVPKD